MQSVPQGADGFCKPFTDMPYAKGGKVRGTASAMTDEGDMTARAIQSRDAAFEPEARRDER